MSAMINLADRLSHHRLVIASKITRAGYDKFRSANTTVFGERRGRREPESYSLHVMLRATVYRQYAVPHLEMGICDDEIIDGAQHGLCCSSVQRMLCVFI